MKVDSGGVVSETDEVNNFSGVGTFDTINLINPTIDLYARSVSITGTPILGQTLTVNTQITNAGTAASGAFDVAFYLSKDPNGSSDDILLSVPTGGGDNDVTHASIAGSSSGATFATQVVLPDSIPSDWNIGSLYVVAKVDADNTVSEINENNNFGGTTGTYTSVSVVASTKDLRGVSFNVPAIAPLNDYITVTGSIQNAGNSASGAFAVEFYLSKSALGGTDDVRLNLTSGTSSHSQSSIGAGLTSSFTIQLATPGSLPSGWNQSSYYVVMKTDATNLVTESNENNNFGQQGIGRDSDTISFQADDWLALNLKDGGILTLTRSRFEDGTLSRQDLIDISREAGADDGTVSSDELADLRVIQANSSRFGIQSHLTVLMNKVVNSNVANARYQGGTLGNLAAGSTNAQLTKLVDKWFLGADRPNAEGYTYRTVSGSLFVNGTDYTDINQGAVGDCYYVATLAGLALRDDQAIQDMFIDNGDNTYTVRFFERVGGTWVADYVTVDKMLPTTSWGAAVYADWGGGSYTNSGNELWVALAEKAYAQINEEAQISQDGTNSYQGIAGGWMNNVLSHIRGRDYSLSWMSSGVTETQWRNHFVNGGIVMPGTWSTAESPWVGGHAYLQINAYENSGTWYYDFYNPWGYNHANTLTWARITSNISGVVFG
jgi:Calpain family cysteine protease/CARDB